MCIAVKAERPIAANKNEVVNMNIYLTNSKAVLPDRVLNDCSMEIEDGCIAAVNPERTRRRRCRELSLEGRLLLPGLVDLRCEVIEQAIDPGPNVPFPIRFALQQADKLFASAGITTVYHSLPLASNAWGGSGTGFAEMIVAEIRKYNSKALVDNRAHCRYEVTDPGSMDAIVRLIRNKEAQLVSFTNHTPGHEQFKNFAAHVHYYSREFGVTVSQVETILGEDLQSTTGALQRMEKIARIARRHGIPLASLSDDSPDTVHMMHALGVTVAGFPVTLAAAEQARRQNMHTMFGAPNIVSNTGRRGSVRAMESLRQGDLACLCSAYSPTSLIRTLLPVVRDGGLTLPQAVKLVSANPAAAAGLPDRGSIRAGLRADFVVIGFAQGLPVVFSTFSRGRQVYGADYHEAPSQFALAC